jgi:hypothetical protein
MSTMTSRCRRAALMVALIAAVAPPVLAAEPVPFLGPEGQADYQHFQVAGFHRAFAISEGGGYGLGDGWPTLEGATQRALEGCQKRDPRGKCAVYAVDGYVVWGKDPASLPRYAAAPKLGAFIPSDYTPVLGPEKAAGLIIWSHGYLPGVDATQGPPQGYVARFEAVGWDVYRFNREWIPQIHTEIQLMMDSIKAARAAGYRKVVLAGQSHGAWASLEALARDAPVDGVIAVSPARHGSPPTSQARSDFRQLIRDIRSRNAADIPLVIALFQNDSFDPGGRFADVPDILGGSAVPLYLIDRPAGLTGHGAGNGFAFNRRFGPCIIQFVLETPHSPGHCE